MHREKIWTSSLLEIAKYDPIYLGAMRFEVQFTNEEGIDAGGPYREWFGLILRECVSIPFI